jgi:hypothetical protein
VTAKTSIKFVSIEHVHEKYKYGMHSSLLYTVSQSTLLIELFSRLMLLPWLQNIFRLHKQILIHKTRGKVDW